MPEASVTIIVVPPPGLIWNTNRFESPWASKDFNVADSPFVGSISLRLYTSEEAMARSSDTPPTFIVRTKKKRPNNPAPMTREKNEQLAKLIAGRLPPLMGGVAGPGGIPAGGIPAASIAGAAAG